MGAPIIVGRVCILNDGGTWDSLNREQPRSQPRVVATIKRSLDEQPNEATVKVYNLADDTTNRVNGVITLRQDWTPAELAELLRAGASTEPLETTSDNAGIGVLELAWGYADSETIDQPGELDAAIGIGFLGQIVDGPRVEREGQDTLLVMTAQDGGATLGAASVIQEAGGGDVPFEAKSYAAGVRISVILGDMINAIGLSVNVAELDAQIVAGFAAKGYPAAEVALGAGYNASGSARTQIEAFLRNLDLLWSVQNGVFLILDGSSTIPGFEPLELGPDQFIGTPKRIAPNKLAGVTAANPEAIPGRPVNVLTSTIDANYRLFESTTEIDTYSGGQTSLIMTSLGVI